MVTEFNNQLKFVAPFVENGFNNLGASCYQRASFHCMHFFTHVKDAVDRTITVEDLIFFQVWVQKMLGCRLKQNPTIRWLQKKPESKNIEGKGGLDEV